MKWREIEGRVEAECAREVRLARKCTLRIGGEAALWVEPATLDELVDLMKVCAEHGVSPLPVGLGSNSLFPDAGIDAPVVRLAGELAAWEIVDAQGDSARWRVGAGAINAHLVRGLLGEGWVGAEFLTLIPGTFGGSVALNAGTKEAWISNILESATVVTASGDVVELTAHELELSYRHSELPPGAIVASGVVRVVRDDVDEARARAKADKERRNATQPYKLASVGSTFANPPGDYAGRLIEACGLKGHAIGGARVSTLHANFFINEGEATAADFLGLMALARHRVRGQFGVELRPEVRFVGFDGWSELARLEAELAKGGQ